MFISRSCWKVPYISSIFLTKNFLNCKSFNTYKRNSLIGLNFVDKRIRIHNGSKFISIVVRKNMIGKRLGEFSLTKVLGKNISLSKMKKQKDKLKQKKRKK